VGSLAPLLVEVSRTLTTPSGKTLYEEWKSSRQRELHESQEVPDSELTDTRIGSGSDHTVFLNYLGIPVMGLTFVGPYGVYHSAYDDFYWINHFGDSEYRYHALMTELWGVLGLRLANAEILQYDFEAYGDSIREFVRTLDDETHVSAHIKFPALDQAVREFRTAGQELNQSIQQAIATGKFRPGSALRVNQALIQVERNWCNPEGIPGRPWFKHSIYGTRYTYAHLELPGLTEAAEAGDWKRAGEQAQVIEDELKKNTELLQKTRQEIDSISEVDAPE